MPTEELAASGRAGSSMKAGSLIGSELASLSETDETVRRVVRADRLRGIAANSSEEPSC